MNYKQEAPFSIQVELTKGCNLQCSFCGINGFQDRPGKGLQFMTLALAAKLAKQIADLKWTSRLEFAMHGEPTMNQDWIEIISIFRSKLSNQIMVTSNGGGIANSRNGIANTVESYFNAGGTILAIDEYQKIKFADKIRRGIDELSLNEIGVTVCEYPENKAGNPHRRIKGKLLTFIAPIDLSKKGTHASLGNHCGAASKLQFDVAQRCAKPFRELSINWNGSVNLCCNDFIGEFDAGNINHTGLNDIWNGPEFTSARKFLMLPDRTALRPCRGCTHRTYRNGLLPDKKGKVTLDEPTDKDRQTVLDALFGGPDRGPTAKAIANIKPHLTDEEKENW